MGSPLPSGDGPLPDEAEVRQINGALPLAYPNNINPASDYTCIVFVFVYSLGYSLGFGPASWVYGSEVRCQFAVCGAGTRLMARTDLPDLSSCTRAQLRRVRRSH